MYYKPRYSIFLLLCFGGICSSVIAKELMTEPGAASASDPVPMGRDTLQRRKAVEMTLKNNSAPDHSPGVDTGSKVPIPHDRNGMVGTPPPPNGAPDGAQ